MQPNCEVNVIHEDKVSQVVKEMRTIDFRANATIFKAIADETRLKIAYALTIEEELCVCDIAAIIGSSNATASHHLRLLRNLGLASYRKEGKLVYYSLKSPHIKNIIALQFAEESEVV